VERQRRGDSGFGPPLPRPLTGGRRGAVKPRPFVSRRRPGAVLARPLASVSVALQAIAMTGVMAPARAASRRVARSPCAAKL